MDRDRLNKDLWTLRDIRVKAENLDDTLAEMHAPLTTREIIYHVDKTIELYKTMLEEDRAERLLGELPLRGKKIDEDEVKILKVSITPKPPYGYNFEVTYKVRGVTMTMAGYMSKNDEEAYIAYTKRSVSLYSLYCARCGRVFEKSSQHKFVYIPSRNTDLPVCRSEKKCTEYSV